MSRPLFHEHFQAAVRAIYNGLSSPHIPDAEGGQRAATLTRSCKLGTTHVHQTDAFTRCTRTNPRSDLTRLSQAVAVQWLQASVQLAVEAGTKPILPYCNECETEETERSNRPYPGWKLNLLQPAKSFTALATGGLQEYSMG